MAYSLKLPGWMQNSAEAMWFILLGKTHESISSPSHKGKIIRRYVLGWLARAITVYRWTDMN